MSAKYCVLSEFAATSTVVAGQRDRSAVARVVATRLAKSPYLPLRRLVCHYRDDTLTLRGSVPTFYLRQLALALITDLAGTVQCVDKIEVVGPASRRPAR